MPSFKEGSALEDLYETIMEHVHQGSFDDERLHKLAERVKDRQWKLYQQVQIGDRIRVIGNMAPKYIVGATGTVVAKFKEKIEVDIEPEFIKGRRFEGKGPLGFPFTNFIKIGDKQPTTLTAEDISPATKNLQDRINKFLETQDG